MRIVYLFMCLLFAVLHGLLIASQSCLYGSYALLFIISIAVYGLLV